MKNVATILLIGKRARILSTLAELLKQDGFTVRQTDDLGHLETVDVENVDVVAFGRALTDQQKQALEQSYLQKNPQLVFVHGLAPIPPLLVAQIKAALTSRQKVTSTPVSYDSKSRVVHVNIAHPATITVTAWWLTIFFNAKTTQIMSGLAEQGEHDIAIPANLHNKRLFVVVTVDEATYVF